MGEEKNFNIGDTAFYASAGQEQIWIVCPECMGSGRLRVILGDYTEVSIACVCCERGYEGSPGKISTYKFLAKIEEVVISGVETELHDGKLRTKYKINGYYDPKTTDLFHARPFAQERADEIAAENAAEEAKRLRYKEKQNKTWAWNVCYWRKEIREAKQRIERAEARLNVAPKNVKELDKAVQ